MLAADPSCVYQPSENAPVIERAFHFLVRAAVESTHWGDASE